MGVDAGQHPDLHGLVLCGTLLHEVHAARRLSRVGGEGEALGAGPLGEAQALEDRPGPLHRAPYIGLGRWVGVEGHHIEAGPQEIRGPAGPDQPRAVAADT